MAHGRDPWAVLGLERGETDRKAIRRGYAKALRANPPEADAGAFRLVRDAYEFLSGTDPSHLTWVAGELDEEDRYEAGQVAVDFEDVKVTLDPDLLDDPPHDTEVPEAGGPDPRSIAPIDVPVDAGDHRPASIEMSSERARPAVHEEQPSVEPERPPDRQPQAPPEEPALPVEPDVTPPERWAAEIRTHLTAAFMRGGEDHKPHVRHALRQAWEDSESDWQRRIALVRMLESTFAASYQGAIAESAPRTVVQDSLVSGEHEFAHWVARALARTGRHKHLRAFAAVVTKHAHEMCADDASYWLLQIAASLAVVEPASAERVADAAYEIATLSWRRQLNAKRVDELLRVGREVAFWKPQARGRLAWIAEAGGYPEGVSKRKFDVVAEGMNATTHARLTRNLLRSLAPGILERTEAAERKRRVRNVGRYRSGSSSSGPSSNMMAFLAALAIIGALRMCVGRFNARDNSSRDALEQYEEFRRQLERNRLDRENRLREWRPDGDDR